jgi:hypothetical protein
MCISSWGQSYHLHLVVVDIPEEHALPFFSCPSMNEPVQLRTNYPDILSVRTRRRKMRAVPRYEERRPAAKVSSLLASATSYSSTGVKLSEWFEIIRMEENNSKTSIISKTFN